MRGCHDRAEVVKTAEDSCGGCRRRWRTLQDRDKEGGRKKISYVCASTRKEWRCEVKRVKDVRELGSTRS
mgnify:CR=1 FL=1